MLETGHDCGLCGHSELSILALKNNSRKLSARMIALSNNQCYNIVMAESE